MSRALNWCSRFMKIVLFPSAFHPNLGGVEELTRQLAHALQRREHQVWVVSHRWPLDLPAYEEFENLPLHRIAFVAAPQGFGPAALKARAAWRRRSGAAQRETARLVAQIQPDIIHIQCAGPNAFYAHGAARAAQVPLVLSAQGELTIDDSGIYQAKWMRANLRALLADAAYVTACSRDSLNDVKAFAAPASIAEKSRVIYNGISLHDFTQMTDAHAHAQPYIFALGRFVWKKGFDVLLQAFARAGLDDFDLILAGDGPERAHLQELARGQRNVHFWGRAERADVVRLLRGCAWFVLPSRIEPQGIVNLEAMAAGRAVIASCVGGVPEIVLDGETGVLVPPDDVEALTAALQTLAEQPRRRSALGSAGLERAQNFDWDELAAQYEEVYRASVA